MLCDSDVLKYNGEVQFIIKKVIICLRVVVNYNYIFILVYFI